MATQEITQPEFSIPVFKELQPEYVIPLINHIGDQEKHFNSLETQYRLLASTWLLASLGAIGYALQKDKIILVDKWVITGLIGLIGDIGILLLWLLDMKVYHKLLTAAFLNGIYLEEQFDWLPKIRTDMMIDQEGGDVIRNTKLYYIWSSTLLLGISLLSFALFIESRPWKIVVIAAGLCLIVFQVLYIRNSSRNSRATWLFEKLKEKYSRR